MDKYSALETVRRAGMTTTDIANSIYLATVEGISGANQNDVHSRLLQNYGI